jgi:hypothetical protein
LTWLFLSLQREVVDFEAAPSGLRQRTHNDRRRKKAPSIHPRKVCTNPRLTSRRRDGARFSDLPKFFPGPAMVVRAISSKVAGQMSIEAKARAPSMYAGFPAVEVGPAVASWKDPMPEERRDQVAFFRREGFLILRSLLNSEERLELVREVVRMASDWTAMPNIREGFDFEPKQHPGRKVHALRKIGGVTELSPAFARLMRHPVVCALMREIMGAPIQLFRDVVMMKPAQVGREKPWHQDSVYWPWQPMDLVSAMTALDDADETNGCLQIIPRSHQKELQHYGRELQVDIGDLRDQTFYVPLRAGDTLLFHSLLLHASEPNRSNRDRRVVIISYKRPSLRWIGKGEPEDSPLIGE